MIRGIIFDLDGTLVDSLSDIHKAANITLQKIGLKKADKEEVRKAIGNGLYKLWERLLKFRLTETEIQEAMAKYFSLFLQEYESGILDNTEVYTGLIPLLQELKAQGVRLAINTNKNQEPATEIVRKCFGDIFDPIYGFRQDIAPKPSEEAVNIIADIWDLPKSEIIYIGDSEVDLLTAINAGISSIHVNWGYRKSTELSEPSFMVNVDSPTELKEYLLQRIARNGLERKASFSAELRYYKNLANLQLSWDFSPECLKTAKKLPKLLSSKSLQKMQADLLSRRRDLSELKTLSIDGKDARDLDDAISVQRELNNYRLFVHIADVAEYVSEDGPIDRDAIERGTSIYFSDMVLPMLPQELSQGICSLNEGKKRLALTVEILLNDKAEIVEAEIYESIIKSDLRADYDSVYEIMEGLKKADSRYKSFVPELQILKELSAKRRKIAQNRGYFDFDISEYKIKREIKNEDYSRENAGAVIGVEKYHTTWANVIIEDCMLLANEVVAEMFFNFKAPFLYRIHEDPNLEKLQDFIRLARQEGMRLRLGKASDRVYWSKILKSLNQESKRLLENRNLSLAYLNNKFNIILQKKEKRIFHSDEAGEIYAGELNSFNNNNDKNGNIINNGYNVDNADKKGKRESTEIIIKNLKTETELIREFQEEKFIFEQSEKISALSQLLLRSMAKACYSAECVGHYGLSLFYYSHFTSPIRRYPDLFIHRVIKAYLKQKRLYSINETVVEKNYVYLSKKDNELFNKIYAFNKKWQEKINYWKHVAKERAISCSEQERLAIQAERIEFDWRSSQYLKKFVGENFLGKVTGFTAQACFVQLPNGIEGMLPFTAFKEYLIFYPEEMQVRNRQGEIVYKLGQVVAVTIARVNETKAFIDFEPADFRVQNQFLVQDKVFHKRKKSKNKKQKREIGQACCRKSSDLKSDKTGYYKAGRKNISKDGNIISKKNSKQGQKKRKKNKKWN